MRYLIPLLFLLGACQVPNQQDADGSTQVVAILTSNVINDGASPAAECSMNGDADCDLECMENCDKMGTADCPMAGDADCDKADCAEGAACCEQGKCEEE